MFKKNRKMLVAMCALALSASATAGGLTIGASADDSEVEVNPIAKYTFADETNLGKDSMGNYDLATEGTVTKSANGALFAGSGVLHSPSEDKDISEELTNFTLNFTMTADANTARAQIIGFGWNDWTATKYSWFTINQGGTNDVRYSMHGSGDGTTGRDWGKDIVTATVDTTYKVTLTVEVGGNAVVYVDGEQKYSYSVSADWNMKDGNTQFCIGGDWTWYNENRSPYKGEVGGVTIYDFAMNPTEVAAYWTDGKLTANEKAKVTSATVDYSDTIKVEKDGPENEILAMAPTAPIDVTLSDETTVKAPVSWTDVVVEEGVTYIVGTLKGVYNPDNVQAKLKLGYMAEVKEILPIAKYDFADANDLGKDSMGNYNLSVAGTPIKDDVGAYFDGKSMLYLEESNDISDKLDSFTLTFDIKAAGAQGSEYWSTPIGFGLDNWTSTKWCWFQYAGADTLLRFSAGAEMGKDDAYWGYEIQSDTGSAVYTITLTVDYTSDQMVVYSNGLAIKTLAIPEGWNLQSGQQRFAIGGAAIWDVGRPMNFVGSIGNVAIYDFAMTADQISTYNSLGTLKTNALTNNEQYVTEVGTELTFADDKVVASELFDNMEVSEMLSKMGNATVVVTLSDGSTKNQPVIWTNVANADGAWKAYGYVENTGLGIPTTVGRTLVETVVPVTASKQVAVGEVTNGSVSVSQTYGLPGDSIEITTTANKHYELDKVYVDGNEIVANEEGKYIYTMGDKDVVVTATFKSVVYSVTADASIENGTLSFSPAEGVYDTEVTITATPAQYYVLSKVYVNGEEITREGANYTFKISGNMTVNATFVEASYSVDAFVMGGNGTASADKTTAKGGETVVVTTTPNEGYEVEYVKVNGTAIEAVEGVYSVTVEGDVEIEVKFKAIPAVEPDSGSSDTGSSEAPDENSSTTDENSSTTDTNSSTDNNSVKDSSSASGGCGSTIGLAAGITMLSAAACVFFKKRKED